MKNKTIKITLVSMIIMLIINCSGCSKGLTDAEKADYYSMQNAYNSINYSIDASKYKEAVSFLVSTDIYKQTKLNDAKQKYNDVLSDKIFSDIQDQIDKITTSAEDKSYNDVPIQGDTKQTNVSNGSYPIYGIPYSIINYGTKEESDESLQEFNETPDNSVESINAYNGMLTARIMNKYSGEFMIQAQLDKNGKISSYARYR